MSGIVGIVNTDGAPVDRGLLQTMTDYMAFRGPDAQEIWIDGPVGFGHTLLSLDDGAHCQRQPRSLDGDVWITADARIDDQVMLRDKLTRAGSPPQQGIIDADLILLAYRVWGRSCVDHLLGDFAFAIWDGPQRKLFCARDHFGVRLLYYAAVGNHLIFSNTLDVIRLHPAVSNELNDLTIVNYLLYRYQPNLAITSFVDIQSLPPAHTLRWNEGELRVQRYWSLPIDEPTRDQQPEEVVEGFREVLDAAVGDRLRGRGAGVFMSGGMDSTSVAGSAHHILSQRGNDFDLRAYTYVNDTVISDEERYWSGLVAEHLDIPITHVSLDNDTLFRDWDSEGFRLPEPSPFGGAALTNLAYCSMNAAGIRTCFSGDGPDVLLCFEPETYIIDALKQRKWSQLVRDISAYHRERGLRNGLGIRRHLRRTLGLEHEDWSDATMRDMLQPALLDQFPQALDWWQGNGKPPSHPYRPSAYAQIVDPSWVVGFINRDASWTGWQLDMCYPYFDVRVVRFCLAIYQRPWCGRKNLLRMSMRNRLPEATLRRPKAPVVGNPQLAWAPWVEQIDFNSRALSYYIDRDRLADHLKIGWSTHSSELKSIIALSFWLMMQV